MQINRVETRIRNYSDEQLASMQKQARTQVFNSSINMLNGFRMDSLINVLSAMVAVDQGRPPEKVRPSDEDLQNYGQSLIGTVKIDILLKIEAKLAIESNRRKAYK